MHKDTHTRKSPRSTLARAPPPSAHDPDLLLLEALLELVQQVHRPRDAGSGESLDGARCEAPFELAGAQQPLEARAGEAHPDAPAVRAIGGALPHSLLLEPLH